MVSIFLEDPTYIIAISILVVCILSVMLVTTGRGVFLYAMIGVLVAGVALVGFERWYVTEKERVEAAVFALCDAVKAEDIPAVRALIAEKTVKDIRSRASSEIQRYQVTQIKINNLKINFDRPTPQPTAEVRLVAVVRAGLKGSGDIPPITVPVAFILTYEKSGDKWLLSDYEYSLQLGEFM